MARESARTGGRAARRALALAAFALAAVAATAWAAFPQDPPNDPEYAPAESGPAAVTCLTESGDNQEHYLFSKIPQCTPAAQDPEGSAGMFIDSAWRDFTAGNPSTVIAYIEGGINWHIGDAEELAERVYLNAGELPAPTTPVNDGTLSAKDFSDTADSNNNGAVDPEDIIVRFSNGSDEDGNRYTDDISGWDFYNDQNDPATLDSKYDHANNQMKQAAAETNNGIGGAGICPHCRLLPVKAGAEALDRSDDLAQAWMFAADSGADVLVSTTADLGYSTFMEKAVDYVWRKGTVMVESSNDFNSTDHQGGMFHQHVLPGNGMVANSHSAVEPPPFAAPTQNGITTTYRARSGYTSWGTHNMFTVATTGGTTSESTPTLGAVVALLRAYGKEAAGQGKIAGPLTPSESIQVLRATASDVAAPVPAPVAWPAKPGWDLQYGYGRPNVYRAMQAVAANDIPPEAWIKRPRWYALFDPTRRKKVKVTGHVAIRRAKSARWVLQFAPGGEPEDSEFRTAGKGRVPRKGKGKKGKRRKRGKVYNGKLGTIRLGRIPRSFWAKAFRLSQRKELETNEHYTVTIRLRVFDNNGRMAEERRSIALHHDPTLRRGFPRHIGPGGEAQPALADLQGRGSQAIIFGDSDGRMHAMTGRGKELPGFPVFTNRTKVTRRHKGVKPGHEPIFINAALGDLDHNGRQWIVATSSTGRTYVWNSHGKRRKGWPKVLNTGVSKPPIPRPEAPFTRPPIQGSTAGPVLANLNRDPKLEIIQSGWDGRIHVWKPNGRKLKGWPVEVTLPPGTSSGGLKTINDHKLDLAPALAELDGDRRPELIQRTQYSFTSDAGLQVFDGSRSNIVAYNHDGSRVPGFLISGTAFAFYYGSAQEFITEGVNPPFTADVDGDGRTEIASAAGIFTPTSLYNADGSERAVYGPVPGSTLTLFNGDPEALMQAMNGNLPDDTPVNFTTGGAFGRFAGQLTYAEPGSGAASAITSLLTPGSGTPINSYIRAFGAASADPVPGFPAKIQGLDFLGVPVIADVSGDGANEVLVGGDSSALHAFNAAGGQAGGFPKFHTGWVLFAPAVGDIDGDGRNEVAATTREGYVMVWNTHGRAGSNDQWWAPAHDERNTGMYGGDTRPPGVARKARIRNDKLRFRAPGDDWYAGRAKRLVVKFVRRGRKAKRVRIQPGPAGSAIAIKAPGGTTKAKVRAIDEAGNLGRSKVVKRARRA